MFPNASFSTLVDLPQITLIMQLCNQTIEQVTEEKDLGVIIDNQMKYHQHVSFATSKARRTSVLYKLKKVSISIEQNVFRITPTIHLDQNRIENAQRAVTRLVPSIYQTSYLRTNTPGTQITNS